MKLYIYTLLLVATLLTACHTNDEVDSSLPTSEPIQFGTEVLTRGEIITQATIVNFGVFCSYTAQKSWAEAKETATLNKMNNLKVTRQPDNSWRYGQPIGWTDPDGKEVALTDFFHFFAYAPYSESSPSSNIKVNTSSTSTDAPTLTYTQPYNIAQQTDLLVANPRLDVKRTSYQIYMQFNHALSRISFSANIADALPNFTYTITEIAMNYAPDNGSVFSKARLNMKTLIWDAFEEAIAVGTETPLPIQTDVALSSEAKLISATNSYPFFIPQEVQQDAIRLKFVVQRKGTNQEMVAKTINNVPMPATSWKRGKAYNYKYTINYESSNIALQEVNVIDWTISSGGSMDIN